MNKTVSIILSIGLVIGIGIIFIGRSKKNTSNTGSVQQAEVKDGVQYIAINAKGGYSPHITDIKAGIPTKLIINTNSTYDCSASLIIRSIGFQKILPQTGRTEIDLGVPKTGQSITGVCGMGMYSFVINSK
jgi:plastocyanin domain-containing protein